MKATHYKLAECQYSDCSHSFEQKNLRKKYCSCSCRVRACNRRKKESGLGGHSTPSSAASAPGSITFSAEQFQELKTLLQQVHRVEAKEEGSIDLTRVVEAGLGTLAGNALIGLMGKTTLEEKVDYLIHLVVALVRKQNGIPMKATTTSPAIKSNGLTSIQAASQQTASGLSTKPASSGWGIVMPK